MTLDRPDFDAILAEGARHRYAGGEVAVIRVLTDAVITLTSGHVTFEDPTDPLPGYMCPLRRGVLPETPPVPPGHYPVHLMVADITDTDGSPEVTSKVAAVRLVVRDEPAVAWDLHEDYPDGELAPGNQGSDASNVVGLTDCQMCGTFDTRDLHEIATGYLRDSADSYSAGTIADWFIEAYEAGSGYLEDNGFPTEPIEHAMVLFPTGWTAGYYRTWAGRGADGGVVCLLTDFEVLSETVGPDPRR
jgi:hypothetical protein